MADQTSQLWTLAAGYFHQDFDLMAPTPDGILENYARQASVEARRKLVMEIDSVLAGNPSETDLERLWNDTNRSAFDPVDRLGVAYRDWFLHIIEVVSAEPS